MQRGWLTPVSLHYVRNHGPVPRLEWGKHRCRWHPNLQLPSLRLSAPSETAACAGSPRTRLLRGIMPEVLERDVHQLSTP